MSEQTTEQDNPKEPELSIYIGQHEGEDSQTLINNLAKSSLEIGSVVAAACNEDFGTAERVMGITISSSASISTEEERVSLSRASELLYDMLGFFCSEQTHIAFILGMLLQRHGADLMGGELLEDSEDTSDNES